MPAPRFNKDHMAGMNNSYLIKITLLAKMRILLSNNIHLELGSFRSLNFKQMGQAITEVTAAITRARKADSQHINVILTSKIRMSLLNNTLCRISLVRSVNFKQMGSAITKGDCFYNWSFQDMVTWPRMQKNTVKNVRNVSSKASELYLSCNCTGEGFPTEQDMTKYKDRTKQ